MVADVINRITTDPWKYIKDIDLDGKKAQLDDMEFPNFPDNCWTLDVAKQTNSTPQYIPFTFRRDSTRSAEIFVEDRLVSLKRASSFSKFSTVGPRIQRTKKKFKGYALEIDQEISDERDKKFGCRNYPTESYPTYQDCDKDFVRKWVENQTNLVPVWASENQNETTTFSVDVKAWKDSDLKFIVGSDRTECPLPCKTTKISVR